MNVNLKGKTALVCGGSKGIGQAIAIELAQLGANVILMARSKPELEATQGQLDTRQGKTHSNHTVDMTDRSGLQETINSILESTNIHILINNTGGPASGPIINATEEDFIKALGMHVGASQLLVKAVMDGMVADGAAGWGDRNRTGTIRW